MDRGWALNLIAGTIILREEGTRRHRTLWEGGTEIREYIPKPRTLSNSLPLRRGHAVGLPLQPPGEVSCPVLDFKFHVSKNKFKNKFRSYYATIYIIFLILVFVSSLLSLHFLINIAHRIVKCLLFFLLETFTYFSQWVSIPWMTVPTSASCLIQALMLACLFRPSFPLIFNMLCDVSVEIQKSIEPWDLIEMGIKERFPQFDKQLGCI